MNSSPAARRWQPNYLVLLIVGLVACTSDAADSVRLWVDADGLFSVKARLIEVNDENVVLLRADGGQITIKIEQLSDRDKSIWKSSRSGRVRTTTGTTRGA
jgi:hypothetical protein